jgi:hypothetical protein
VRRAFVDFDLGGQTRLREGLLQHVLVFGRPLIVVGGDRDQGTAPWSHAAPSHTLSEPTLYPNRRECGSPVSRAMQAFER